MVWYLINKAGFGIMMPPKKYFKNIMEEKAKVFFLKTGRISFVTLYYIYWNEPIYFIYIKDI